MPDTTDFSLCAVCRRWGGPICADCSARFGAARPRCRACGLPTGTAQASCGACHSFSTFWEGSGLAPDLTPVGTKFAREEILRSILEPSATINGQYYFTNFKLKNGTVIPGMLREVKDKKYRIAVSVAAPDAVIEIPEADIVSEENSPVSPMPVGLLNAFTKDQILDLLAFLDSGGNPDAPVYSKK